MNHFHGWTRAALACAFALAALPAVAEDAGSAPAAATTAPAAPAAPAAAPTKSETSGEATTTVGGEPLVEGMVSKAEAEALAKKPWIVTASLGTGTGMMLLDPTPYVRSYYSSFTMNLGVSGMYKLADTLMAAVNVGGALELTTPNDPGGRRFWWGDPSVSINDQSLYRDALTGINVSGGASLSFGLSPTSLYTTNIATLGLNVAGSRRFLDGRLSVGLGLMGAGFLNRYSSPVVSKLASDAIEMGIVRSGGAEDLGATLAAASGNNPVLQGGANLSVGYRITDRLGASVGFGLMRVWSSAGPCDEFTPTVVDSNGNPVGKCGLAPMDAMSGNVGVSYQIDSRFAVSGSLNTGGQVFGYDRVDPSNPDADLTTEARHLRFPFWDPNLQGSSLSLGVSATF